MLVMSPHFNTVIGILREQGYEPYCQDMPRNLRGCGALTDAVIVGDSDVNFVPAREGTPSMTHAEFIAIYGRRFATEDTQYTIGLTR